MSGGERLEVVGGLVYAARALAASWPDLHALDEAAGTLREAERRLCAHAGGCGLAWRDAAEREAAARRWDAMARRDWPGALRLEIGALALYLLEPGQWRQVADFAERVRVMRRAVAAAARRWWAFAGEQYGMEPEQVREFWQREAARCERRARARAVGDAARAARQACG